MRARPLALLIALASSLVLIAVVARPVRAQQPEPEAPPVELWSETSSAPLQIEGTWEQVRLPMTRPHYPGLSIHPTDARTLLITVNGDLHRSNDAGEHWTPITVTLPISGSSFVDEAYVHTVLYAPSLPSRLYATRHTWDETDSNLIRSDDGGAHWYKVDRTEDFCDLTVAPLDPDRLYAHTCAGQPYTPGEGSIFVSTDGGASWERPATPFTNTVRSLLVTPADPSIVLVTTDKGLFRSGDGARTWSRVLDAFLWDLVVQPSRPHWLFATDWGAIYRSRDHGQSWERINSPTWGTVALAAWPRANGSLAAVTTYDGRANHALYQTTPTGWSRRTWSAPAGTLDLYRSATDDRVLYARDNAGTLWRLATTIRPLANTVYLPAVFNSAAPPPASDADAAAALGRTNAYRAILGIAPILEETRITRAAENHAWYSVFNAGDDAAWANGPHGEVPGKPGFTGEDPTVRCRAAGFPSGCGEVKHYLNDPIAAVDGWMATLYHRLPLIDPTVTVAGYGRAQHDGHVVDVLDMAGTPVNVGVWLPAAPSLWVYPAPGQQEVPPLWNGGEWPDPLPPGAAHPVGYPVTIQGLWATLAVQEATLHEPGGALVPVHPNVERNKAWGVYALIPVTPLKPQTTYTVHVRATLNGTLVEKRWSFTTGASMDWAHGTGTDELRPIGPPVALPEQPTPPVEGPRAE